MCQGGFFRTKLPSQSLDTKCALNYALIIVPGRIKLHSRIILRVNRYWFISITLTNMCLREEILALCLTVSWELVFVGKFNTGGLPFGTGVTVLLAEKYSHNWETSFVPTTFQQGPRLN